MQLFRKYTRTYPSERRASLGSSSSSSAEEADDDNSRAGGVGGPSSELDDSASG